jgi:hypothetical protein
MFFRSLIVAFLLLTGTGLINSALKINQPIAEEYPGSIYIEYVWIEGVRWAFEYLEDGTFIRSYIDPE